MKIFVILLTSILFISFVHTDQVSAAVSYPSYNYSYWEDTDPAAVPYVPSHIIDGRNNEIGLFNGPEDIYVSNDNKIYVADTGNNRIVILNQQFKLLDSIESFQNGDRMDSFSQPSGIHVTDDHHIYVADTGNKRIVVLKDNQLTKEIGSPKSDVIREGFEYRPIKVAVDKANRIFVIGRGIFDGIIEFDSDGDFTGFIGANRVRFNPIDYVWRMIATDEQRAKMALFIPMEFNNLNIDDEGFIYTTNAEENTQIPIQRLNPTGENVLRNEGYHPIIGDLQYAHTGSYTGTSTFVDISVNEYGVYSALDMKRGRIFTYDEDGNLLYVFGQIGTQVGTFRTPVAIDRIGEKIIVLDKGNHRLTVFEPTAFGSLVNEAVKYYFNGDDETSAHYWEDVLRLNVNYEIAYIGIGKSLLMKGKHEEAMSYFKNGHSRKYYSKAFKRYRQDLLREHFGTMMTIFVFIIVALLCIKPIINYRRKRVNIIGKGIH
ncbi:gluconolactonase [Gracilibacillus marinus]|uniref:Gluconolactonase n=1 Tax=Gracilibacillus marinus TaxID=630535 RepID=A0ABV8VYB8_9BACI